MATPNSPPATTTGKRTRPLTPHRSSTSTPVSPSSSPPISSPETKIARSSASPINSSDTNGLQDNKDSRSILCTLPPTCSQHPIMLANSKELERHYATYHAHVCEQPGCGCVFPEARLLELHQTECHDPLAAVRKERGEKIFGCMVTTCTRFFQTPKTRRLHMIEAHKYPKEFFFAVTNKGIGGLLKKWGEGASMIRGEWKPREDENTKKEKGKAEKNQEDRMMVEDDEDDSESDESASDEEHDMDELERTPKPGARPLNPASPPRNQKTNSSADVDALAEGMSSLTLIPSSIRFGRGGRGGGLGARSRGRGGRGGVVPLKNNTAGAGHQRRASTSSVTNTRQPETSISGGGKGRGQRSKGHRASTSIATGMEMDVSGGEGGDVILLPPSGSTRGRGRGKRGVKDTTH